MRIEQCAAGGYIAIEDIAAPEAITRQEITANGRTHAEAISNMLTVLEQAKRYDDIVREALQKRKDRLEREGWKPVL